MGTVLRLPRAVGWKSRCIHHVARFSMENGETVLLYSSTQPAESRSKEPKVDTCHRLFARPPARPPAARLPACLPAARPPACLPLAALPAARTLPAARPLVSPISAHSPASLLLAHPFARSLASFSPDRPPARVCLARLLTRSFLVRPPARFSLSRARRPCPARPTSRCSSLVLLILVHCAALPPFFCPCCYLVVQVIISR